MPVPGFFALCQAGIDIARLPSVESMMRLLFLFAVSLAGVAHAAPRLLVPIDLSAPAPKSVRLHGVKPGTQVKIITARSAHDGKTCYVGEATFVADALGRVDTATAVAREGTYTGVDPLGLFWSAKSHLIPPTYPVSDDVHITATAAGSVIAVATARTHPDPVAILTSMDTPFAGAVWARPVSPGRHPVVIVLGGSEGGSSTARTMAPLFAARGFATLGLPYYDPGYDPTDRIDGLPHSFTDIPVDRLAAVRAWLATRLDADSSRIALWGVSKGAEFALIAASHYDWIRAVVAVVPTDLVWEGWGRPGPKTASFSFDGKPLAFEPYAGMDLQLARAAKGERMDMRRVHLAGRAAYPERVAAARIPIDQFHGSLLLVAGGRDEIWPSAEMAANIVARRQQARLSTWLIEEPDANHFLGGPGTDPVEDLVTAGAQGPAIAHARGSAWQATFQLLQAVLRPDIVDAKDWPSYARRCRDARRKAAVQPRK